MIHPDQIQNKTFMKSTVGKHLNITKLQEDYIAHNMEQMAYSDNVTVETVPSAECYTKKRLIGKHICSALAYLDLHLLLSHGLVFLSSY